MNLLIYAVIGGLYLLALTALFIFYKGDVIIAAGVLSLAFASIASFIQSAVNNVAIKETHNAVNGKMDKLIAQTEAVGVVNTQTAHTLGIAEGRAQMEDQQ